MHRNSRPIQSPTLMVVIAILSLAFAVNTAVANDGPLSCEQGAAIVWGEVEDADLEYAEYLLTDCLAGSLSTKQRAQAYQDRAVARYDMVSFYAMLLDPDWQLLDEAIDDANAAIRLAPTLPVPYCIRGNALINEDNRDGYEDIAKSKRLGFDCQVDLWF